MDESTPATPPNVIKRKHPAAKCEECPFATDKNYVPTFNPVPSGHIAIIGAAPGVHEARKGIPFTGPSGELADQILHHHGIRRDEVMLTNTVLCKPEGQDSDPPKAALDACRPRLIQEIEESDVHTIVALGKIAMAETITDRGSMRKIRVGPPKPYKHDPNIGVIPTWHTAYALRSPDSFPDIVFDFGKIRGKIKNDWAEPDYRVFDNPVSAARALEELRARFDRVVIDIETGVEKDNSFDHPSEYDLLCVGIAFAKGKAVVIGENALRDDVVRARLRDLLSSTKIIAHNGKFDLAGLRNVCGRQTLWFDTMLASNCLAPGTRTLKSDLTWCNIEDLKPGDELVGFSEHFTSDMKPTKVIATKRQSARTYTIKTAKGDITASAGHRWPVRRPSGLHTKIEWRTTQQLFEQKSQGWRLMHFVDPWEVDRTYEGGYLAGFLDGEGNYAGGGIDNTNGSKRIQFTQNPGDTLSSVLFALRERGYTPHLNGRPGRHAEQWELSNRQAMRLIGEVRPKRFMPKAHELWQGNRRCVPMDILSIEYAGEQEVIGLETSTKTFVAEGFLTHNCLDERPGHHGLKQLSIERLGAPDYEADIRDYVPRGGNYGNIPRSVLYRYNAYDVVCTWDLYELFSNEFTPSDWRKHDFIVQAANALIELELNGIHFDVEYNEKLNHEYQTILSDIEAKMDELVGYTVNPRSPKQLTEYYATQHLQLPSTNADLLKELRDQLEGEVLEFTDLLLEHRRKAKLYGTYVKGLAKRVTSEGKVYTTYTLHGTTSGRLASRQPNLQNVVREKSIRNQFVVAHEDNRLIQLDYKQAEGRVITTLARDEYLREIFADSSRDLFSELCDQIFGVGNWAKENRVAMKAIFYGNAYGRGAASIAKELQLQTPPVNITVPEATQLMREFNALIPDVMAWQRAVKQQVLAGNDLTTPFGRKRSFWLITDKNRSDVLNEALSYLPQSIASDICLRALIRLTPMLRDLATPRLTIHDAIVVETHKDQVEEVIALMSREMIQSATEFTTYVPFEVDASVAQRWGDFD